MAEPKSFLGETKDQLTGLFAEAYDSIATAFENEVPEVIPGSLQKLQRKTWELMEKKLKDSYRNGQKANGNGKLKAAADSDPAAPKPNPFRK